MENIGISDVKRWDWRTTLFRVIALACIVLFLNLGGIASILAPWRSPGFGFPGFTPEIHRWHSALLGVTEAILLPGLLLAMLRRPTMHPILMQFFVLVGVSLVSAHLLTRGSTPISSALIVFPILAFPAPRALLSLPRGGRLSTLLLVLAVLATMLLGFDAWHNLRAQLTHAGGEHALQGHWATAFSLDLVLILAVFFAARRWTGWQVSGWLAAISLLYLGTAALALPHHAGSWSIMGGSLALLGGAGLVVAILREGRATRSWNHTTDEQRPDVS